MKAHIPRVAERLIGWSLSDANRDAILGDLSEEFGARAIEYGTRHARLWYWRQALRSVIPNLRQCIADAALHRRRAHEIPGTHRRGAVERIMTDLRDAVRALRAAPAFTIVALLVLALGIGATTAIFSVVDAVVLRGLPFDEHDRLVAVGERRPPGPQGSDDPHALLSLAGPNYLDLAAQQHVFESMAMVLGPPFAGFTLKPSGAQPEDIRGLRVTAGFFDVLRLRAALGRVFTTENEVAGRHRVVVLSDGLWRRRFGGDPQIVGRTISLESSLIALGGGNDESYEVVGVLPPDANIDVAYPGGALHTSDVLVPYVFSARDRIRDPRGRAMIMKSIARLKRGVSLRQAQAQMDQIATALEQAHPVWNKNNMLGVRPLRDHLVGATTKSWMLMLLGAVGLVLLIACANVANLLLARGTARERELAVRAALGAGRWRLIRQLIVESLVLSTVGTVLATVLGWWAAQVLRSSMPDGVPRVSTIGLDMRVLAAAAGLSLLTALLFGVVPALHLSRPNLTSALKDGAAGAGGSRGSARLRSALVVLEVAVAVILLVGAGLFIGSFAALMRIHPGFSTDRLLTGQVSLPLRPNMRPDDTVVLLATIVERVSQVPGVVHAAMVSGGLPLAGGNMSATIAVPGRDLASDDAIINARVVTPDYHRALGIPLRTGRLLASSDRMDTTSVVLLNESAAKKYFPGEDPIGRVVDITNVNRTIVGIVGDVHQSSLETEPRSEAYVPLAQVGALKGASDLVMRTTGDPYQALPAVKAAIVDVLPDVPLRNVTTMQELFSRRIAQRRLNMLLLGLFGVLGLVISAAGIYGVMAYAVSRRVREIGVRMALGATVSSVVGMILTNAVALVAVGLVIGAAGAWYLSTTAKTFLFGLDPHNPWAFAGAAVVLFIAAVIASVIPAGRAAKVDPMLVLRVE